MADISPQALELFDIMVRNAKRVTIREQLHPTDPTPQDEKAQEIANIIEEMNICGGGKRQMRTLFSCFLGTKVIRNIGEVDYEDYMVVVPVDNPNSHNYPLGAPCMICDPRERFAVTPIGNTGNHLPDIIGDNDAEEDDERSPVRLATLEEINRFFEEVKRGGERRILKVHHIMTAGVDGPRDMEETDGNGEEREDA